MLTSLFCFIYWLWTEAVVIDQVLLLFRPTLILSHIPDYNIVAAPRLVTPIPQMALRDDAAAAAARDTSVDGAA